MTPQQTAPSHWLSAWLAWALWAISVALAALFVPLYWFLPASAIPASGGIAVRVLEAVFVTVLLLALSTVGALIVARRPGNRIGWILLVAGLTIATVNIAGGYATFSLAEYQGNLPGTKWAAWVTWIWLPGVGSALTFLLLLFPNERLPSRRWRPVGWLVAVSLAVTSLGMAFTPGPLTGFPEVNNPLGLAMLRGSVLHQGGVGWMLLLASVVLSAASLVVRYRRAARGARQQIKWLAFAGVFAAVGWVSLSIAYGSEGTVVMVVAGLLQMISFASIPIAVGIAILRYRLYDIDVIINRTLVYGALTAILALVYFGSVFGLQRVLAPLIGPDADVATIASTLAIAALFSPLRRRIQAFIDRRFYRRKYDAAQVLAAFNMRLRDETDLDTLSNDLLTVVEETLQPAHVSLWLREPPVEAQGRRGEETSA